MTDPGEAVVRVTGPWAPEEVIPLVDFSGDAEWHGCPKPAPIEAGTNPGSLVAAVIASDGSEIGRWALTRSDPTAGVDEAARLVSQTAGTRLVIYDGDTGQPVVTAQAPA